MTKLGHYLQKTILVSMPALTGTDSVLPCKLVDIEPFGLWLETDPFGEGVTPSARSDVTPGLQVVFVPFAHIAYVLGDLPQAISVASDTGSKSLSDDISTGPAEPVKDDRNAQVRRRRRS
jgi:hypothetical protein